MRSEYESKVRYDKTNNSFSVTIPSPIASLLKLKAKDKVHIIIEKDTETEQ